MKGFHKFVKTGLSMPSSPPPATTRLRATAASEATDVPMRQRPVDAGGCAPSGVPKAGKRAAHRAARQEAILGAAWELLEEGGIDAITTPELARRTGAALGGLYRFFPSKQAVVVALQKQALHAFFCDLKSHIAQQEEKHAAQPERVRALIAIVEAAEFFLAEPRTHVARFRLIDELLSHPHAFYDESEALEIEQHVTPILDFVGEMSWRIARQYPGNPTRDVELLPLVLWAGLHGTTHFMKRDRFTPTAQSSGAVASTLLRFLLQGMGVDPQDIHEALAAAGVLGAPQQRPTSRFVPG